MRSFRLPLLDPSGNRDSAVPALSPNAFDPSKLQNLALYLRADADVQSNTALQLTASSSQYLSLADTGNENTFNFDGTSFTVSGWFRLNSAGSTEQQIAGKWVNDTADRAWKVSVTPSSRLTMSLTSVDGISIGISPVFTLAIDTWYFFAARYDGANITVRFYGTSALLATRIAAYSSVVNNSPNEFGIGRRSGGGWYFDGRIDSLAIYKGKALSDAECDALWNSGAGTAHSNLSAAQKTSLLAWWGMNEAFGNRLDSHTGGYDMAEGGGPILSAGGIPAGTADDEDSVSLWLGQSPTTNSASQGSALLRPTLQLNLSGGKPGLAFDGSDDILTLSGGLNGSSDFLIAWVERYTSGVSLILSRNGVPTEFIRHDSATSLTVGDDAQGNAQVTHASIGSGYHISMLGSTSATVTYYLDGAAYALATGYVTDWLWDRIGPTGGDLLELIALDGSNLPDGLRNRLGRYLARKYALAWNPTP